MTKANYRRRGNRRESLKRMKRSSRDKFFATEAWFWNLD
jgi:hypothetical protein